MTFSLSYSGCAGIAAGYSSTTETARMRILSSLGSVSVPPFSKSTPHRARAGISVLR